jgi:hypothetical protein
MALMLLFMPHTLMMGIPGHARISLMRPSCMKQVPMNADIQSFTSFIAATLHPRNRASFARMAPLPATITFQNMKGILRHF